MPIGFPKFFLFLTNCWKHSRLITELEKSVKTKSTSIFSSLDISAKFLQEWWMTFAPASLTVGGKSKYFRIIIGISLDQHSIPVFILWFHQSIIFSFNCTTFDPVYKFQILLVFRVNFKACYIVLTNSFQFHLFSEISH